MKWFIVLLMALLVVSCGPTPTPTPPVGTVPSRDPSRSSGDVVAKIIAVETSDYLTIMPNTSPAFIVRVGKGTINATVGQCIIYPYNVTKPTAKMVVECP